MCVIPVENPQENIDFIMYNHLFSREKRSFTVPTLTDELRDRYGLQLSESDVKRRVDEYVYAGRVHENYRDYSVAAAY